MHMYSLLVYVSSCKVHVHCKFQESKKLTSEVDSPYTPKQSSACAYVSVTLISRLSCRLCDLAGAKGHSNSQSREPGHIPV